GWTPVSGGGSRDHGFRNAQGACDFDHRLAAVHRRAPQSLEGFVLSEAEARHQRALGALDDLAALERLLELLRFREARDREVERRRELRWTQRLEEVAHYAGRVRVFDQRSVGMAGDEHDGIDAVVKLRSLLH